MLRCDCVACVWRILHVRIAHVIREHMSTLIQSQGCVLCVLTSCMLVRASVALKRRDLLRLWPPPVPSSHHRVLGDLVYHEPAQRRRVFLLRPPRPRGLGRQRMREAAAGATAAETLLSWRNAERQDLAPNPAAALTAASPILSRDFAVCFPQCRSCSTV